MGAATVLAQEEGEADGQAARQEETQIQRGQFPSLNYNHYYPDLSGQQTVNQVPARLYLAPWPAPPYVGYTYITYPPMQPHEWLWIHRRAYYRDHPGGGRTITTIRWEYRE